MVAECITQPPAFHDHRHREIVARFDGGAITSDGGGLLLRELERRTGIIGRFAECFADHRDPDLIEHTVYELLAQRVYGLCLGYEDLSDHDQLRRDPLLALLVGKEDPTGADRLRERDRGCALAGKSTLNRLEPTPPGASEQSRYKKIVASCASIERSFVDVFLALHEKPPGEIILDLDATDDPLHGGQLGKFYEREYCARGEMENRIKEQQLYLFADRTSCESMRANQLRLWFSSIAYVLMNALRAFGLKGTELEQARCDTIRLKVLKIGARVTFRKIWLHLASGYPYQALLARACENLRRAFPMPLRV